MASEIHKEHSALESQSPHELFHFTKLDDSELSGDPNDFSASVGTLPLPDATAVSMANNNQTDGAPDQIEASEEKGTRRRGKNSRGPPKEETLYLRPSNQQGTLQNHEFTHKKEKRFHCSVCGKGFRNKVGLEGHKKKHSEGTEDEQSVCALCGEPFRLVEDLQKHLNEHIQGRKLMKMASEIHKEHSALEIQSPDELFQFTKLDDSELSGDPNDFSGSGGTLPLPDVTAVSMANNNQTDGAPDQIDTSEDEGTRRRGKNSRGHRQKKKRFTCAVCSKSLSSKQMLQYHELTPTGEKRFACRICGNVFARTSGLRQHELIHSVEKPFACRICGKSFAQRSHLSSHELTHTGEKPFACMICGKSFARRDLLRQHELIHNGKRQFACRICGKSFAQRSHLSCHKLTHTGEKPFACKICGKSFARGSSISSHQLTHTGEKRFHCSVCGRGFRSKVGFQGHTKQHSQVEQSVCALCNQPFRLEEDLEKHLKWHIQSGSLV
ncbi:unnamed protein product [Cyprideis torosa]|uniref:Uncharacterized protein n=1 Tax=Cyprideis torosa TaxID=163714 RepID=A0A7R8ZLF1_9CRUS|nr:unnamed protein product [Cyprideis torosa]CAG0882120.1 unnamed protein product [Cyprideis torosa]